MKRFVELSPVARWIITASCILSAAIVLAAVAMWALSLSLRL